VKAFHKIPESLFQNGANAVDIPRNKFHRNNPFLLSANGLKIEKRFTNASGILDRAAEFFLQKMVVIGDAIY
jgi:hypothetical protein